jgi:hypothetical protein
MEYRIVKFQELRKFQHQFRTALQQVSVMDEKVTDLMKNILIDQKTIPLFGYSNKNSPLNILLK